LSASISTVMIPRGVLDNVGTFNSNMKVAGDCELWNRIADRYPIIRNPRIIADIRAHRRQVTNARMSGLWYMKEEIGMMNWYRARLPAEDWAAVLDFRTRTRAVTYWAWIVRQMLDARIHLAVSGVFAMGKGYNPISAFCYYCLSLN